MIQFEQAGKTYVHPLTRKRVVALEGLDLAMQRGEVFGIAGPNGAGKSTLISLLMGFLHPTSGRVTIDGRAPRTYIEAHGIGYLTELVALPPRWKVPTALERIATLAGVPSGERRATVTALMERLGLTEHAAKQIRQLSKGNLQRVGLAQALLGEFDVVVLDEPTHGLDPLWTQRFRDIVESLRRPDRVILIASHNLDELERLADRVAILDKGRLQRVVARPGSSESAAMRWRIVFEGEVALAAHLAAVEPFPGIANGWRAQATRPEVSRALAAVLGQGAVLVECSPDESRLESAFREAVQR
ncbi:MAG TPA: ABC transporter ATP-binding protein [Gemmatimonadales bacterium]|nr:ABC transporter ATP-binding protein [Gemmatimonadales bacterium]